MLVLGVLGSFLFHEKRKSKRFLGTNKIPVVLFPASIWSQKPTEIQEISPFSCNASCILLEGLEVEDLVVTIVPLVTRLLEENNLGIVHNPDIVFIPV